MGTIKWMRPSGNVLEAADTKENTECCESLGFKRVDSDDSTDSSASGAVTKENPKK